MDENQSKRLLGEWTIKSKKVLIYEFRYKEKNRIGIQIDYKPENAGDPPKLFGYLTVDYIKSRLEPGEFVVNNYDSMKNIWRELRDFPEFQETKKKALYRESPGRQLRIYPIWRLAGYDCKDEKDEEVPLPKDRGLDTTCVAECTFTEIKNMVKQIPTNKNIADMLIVLRKFDDYLTRDVISSIDRDNA